VKLTHAFDRPETKSSSTLSVPTMIGADTTRADAIIARTVPGYMSMGQTGMGSMSAMDMPLPTNSISMRSAPGPHGTIDMGGMFTVLKVREGLTSYDDPGWYQPPPGTLAREATADELAADGVEISRAPR
jgi:hypothetical protein